MHILIPEVANLFHLRGGRFVTTLMKVESGTVNKPSVQTMAKIAKALGVSIEDLIK